MIRSIFLILLSLAFSHAAVPPNLANLAINEINLFAIGSDQFIEITDGGQGNTKLDKVSLVFFDQYGNRYASSDLTGIQTESNGLMAIGTGNHTYPDRWPKSLILNSTAAVALYYLEDGQVPVNVDLRNPGLLDGFVYRSPDTKVGTLVLALQQLMAGFPLLEPKADEMCYDPQHSPPCDKGLSRCLGDLNSHQRRDASSFQGGPLTPGEVNQCPLPYFVINEVQVNPEGGLVNEFVEIRTSDPSGKILRRSLNNVILVGFFDSNIPEGDFDARLNTTFELALDGHQLNDNGYFTIGDKNYPCPPSTKDCITLPWTLDKEFLRPGSFGVALLWGPVPFPTIRSAVQLRVIDSITYTTTNGSFPNRVVGAINLADQDILFINSNTSINGTKEDHISFARQDSLDVSNLAEFVYATPTPDASNKGAYLAPAMVYFTDHKQMLLTCRINEIGLTVAREHQFEAFIPGGSAVSFDFVEVIGPVNTSASLKGLLAVTYAGYADGNYSVIEICNCNTTTLTREGLGVCPCTSKEQFNKTLTAIVSTVLHVGTPEEFDGLPAADGANKLYSDSVAYRTSNVEPQPIAREVRNFFIKNQRYDITQPPIHWKKKLSYSYSRCFGVPEKEPNWLAAWGLTYNVTRGEPNQCPPPMLTVSQFEQLNSSLLVKLDATHNGQDVVAAGVELPLDQATLAAAEDQDGIAIIVTILRFGDVRINPDCQNLIAGSTDYPFSFNMTKPVAVILYWDTFVPAVGGVAPMDGMLFSQVLTPNAAEGIPTSLKNFATDGALEIDETGICSLSKCDNKWMYANSMDPANCLLGQCAPCCKGGCTTTSTVPPNVTTTIPTSHTLDTSLFINELFYDYETKYSYVEIMTTRFGNPLSGLAPATNLYMLALFNANMENVTIDFPKDPISFVQLRKKVVAFSNDPALPSYDRDWSKLKLEADGPGAICIYINQSVRTDTGFYTYNVLCDCVVYTTNPQNTTGLDDLLDAFDNTGYAIQIKSSSQNYSISRCAPGAYSTGIAFVSADATIGNDNECPQSPGEYCIAIQKDGMNCYTDGEEDSRVIFDGVVNMTSKMCDCLAKPINVNFANLSRGLWSCTDDGNLEVRSTVWSVNSHEGVQFDRSIKTLITDNWNDVVALDGGKEVKAKFRSCYYENQPFKSSINILLITSIVVAVIAAVVTVLALACLCWNRCCGSNTFANGVIVPMQGHRIDKSTTDLIPVTDGSMRNENEMLLAATSSSQTHLIPAQRWTPPRKEFEQALLVHQEDPKLDAEHL